MPGLPAKAFWMEGNWAPPLPTWRYTEASTVATGTEESAQTASRIDATTAATGRTEATLT